MLEAKPVGRAPADGETEAAPLLAARMLAEMNPRAFGRFLLGRALFVAHGCLFFSCREILGVRDADYCSSFVLTLSKPHGRDNR